MKNLDRILKALADRKRMRILMLISGRKLCVCEIAHILDATQPAISKHLKKLRSAGLIDCEQDGFWTNYFAAKAKNAHVKTLVECVNKWLFDESVVKNDIQKAAKIDRQKLCCRSDRIRRR